MNDTRKKLEDAYRVRFILTAVCVFFAAMAAHLAGLLHGLNFLGAAVAAFLLGVFGWAGLYYLHVRFKQLRHLDEVREHGPYGTQEFVPPPAAVRQIGDQSSRNLWG